MQLKLYTVSILAYIMRFKKKMFMAWSHYHGVQLIRNNKAF